MNIQQRWYKGFLLQAFIIEFSCVRVFANEPWLIMWIMTRFFPNTIPLLNMNAKLYIFGIVFICLFFTLVINALCITTWLVILATPIFQNEDVILFLWQCPIFIRFLGHLGFLLVLIGLFGLATFSYSLGNLQNLIWLMHTT